MQQCPSTSPYQEPVSSSEPGCSASSGTTQTATPILKPAKTMPAHHPSPEHQENNTSCSPASYVTGASQTLSINGHSAHSEPVPAPATSTTTDEHETTHTTKPYEPSPTGSSASSTAASNTKPPTTNTPPGPTAPTSTKPKTDPPLDIYDPGVSHRSSFGDPSRLRLWNDR